MMMEPVSWSRNWDAEEFFDEDLPDDSSPQAMLTQYFSGPVVRQTGFPDAKQIGEICLPDSQDKATCGVFSLEKDPSVLYKVPADKAHDWTFALFSSIDAERVFIFDTLLESFYQTVAVSKPNPPFLRKLQTSGVQIQDNTSFLEVPNMMENISAAVLSYTILAFQKVVPVALTAQPTPEAFKEATTKYNKKIDNGMYI